MKYYKHFDRLQICGYWFYIARLKRFLKFIFVLWRTDHWKHFVNYFFELSWSKWHYLLSLSISTVVWRFIIAWDRLGLLGTHFCHQTVQWCFIHTNYMDVCIIVYAWSSIGIYNSLHLYRNNHTETTVNCLLGSREDIGYTSSINSLPSLFFTAWDSFRGHIAMLSGGDGLCNGQRQALSIKASDIHDQVISGMWFF